MNPRRTISFCVVALCALPLGASAQPAAAQPLVPAAVGLWQTIDDKTHQPVSVVRTALEDGKLVAYVEKLLKQDIPGDKRCTKCTGDNQNKPVVGLKIIWGLTPDGDVWGDGHVLDPDNGKIYKCKIKAVGASELEVRGFIGVSLFGRTQTWHRVTKQ